MWNKIISKLFQLLSMFIWNNFAWNYFRGLLQLMNIFQHVQCCWNNCEIISVFYFTSNHVLRRRRWKKQLVAVTVLLRVRCLVALRGCEQYLYVAERQRWLWAANHRLCSAARDPYQLSSVLTAFSVTQSAIVDQWRSVWANIFQWLRGT